MCSPESSAMDAARALAARYADAELIVVYGSVARGTATPLSDVDIAVAGLPLWTALELGAELGRVFGREPHIVDLAEATDWLRYEIARTGALLGGKNDAWPRFQAEAALRYFDLQPIIRRCAEGVRRRLVGGAAR